MLIVLDCPSCAKRYEVDAALAGKKSRCKQCGEVFKIPVPRAVPAPPPASKPARPGNVSSGGGRVAVGACGTSRVGEIGFCARAGKVGFRLSARAGSTIVLNCPGCRKRYELDGALAGKKSRCKDCGEVFSIPIPRRRSANRGQLGARRLLRSRPRPRCRPTGSRSSKTNLPRSRRAAVPSTRCTTMLIGLHPHARPIPSRGADRIPIATGRGSNPDVGYTIALFYVGLAILVAIGFWIWTIAAEPTKERIGAISRSLCFLSI